MFDLDMYFETEGVYIGSTCPYNKTLINSDVNLSFTRF